MRWCVCVCASECVGLKPKIIFVFRRQWAQAFSIAIALPNTWKIVPLSKILSVDAKLSWKFFSWCFTDQRIDANKLIYLVQKFFNVSQCAVTGFLCITFIFLGRESIESERVRAMERTRKEWDVHATFRLTSKMYCLYLVKTHNITRKEPKSEKIPSLFFCKLLVWLNEMRVSDEYSSTYYIFAMRTTESNKGNGQ